MKNAPGGYIELDTVTYRVPYLQVCIASGLDRTATPIECAIYLECDSDGSPLHLFVNDLACAEDLYGKLGEFIAHHKTKGN